MSQKKFKQKRKLWYRGLKTIMKIKYKKPTYVYKGQKPTNGSIILSNHVGTDAPMALEIYADFPVRMWGTHKMNSGLISMYKYQSKVYYHEKKHWNLFGARMFCLIASPLTNLFYKGLNLISTYEDIRFKKTIDESLDAIINKKENIVIFPEKSTEGYLDELKGFYAGFVLLAQTLAKNNVDVPIYVSYYKKKENKYLFDKPILFSELKSICSNRDEMAEYLVNKCNTLAEEDNKNNEEKDINSNSKEETSEENK